MVTRSLIAPGAGEQLSPQKSGCIQERIGVFPCDFDAGSSERSGTPAAYVFMNGAFPGSPVQIPRGKQWLSGTWG